MHFRIWEVPGAECDVRSDPITGDLILRHDSFLVSAMDAEESWLGLDRLLDQLCDSGKSIKLDLKSNGHLVEEVLAIVGLNCFNDERLWFNGNVEMLKEHGFRRLAEAHPGAILQCPVDFLGPLICSTEEKAREILEMFTSWGVNRFSIGWAMPNMREVFEHLDDWGYR